MISLRTTVGFLANSWFSNCCRKFLFAAKRKEEGSGHVLMAGKDISRVVLLYESKEILYLGQHPAGNVFFVSLERCEIESLTFRIESGLAL